MKKLLIIFMAVCLVGLLRAQPVQIYFADPGTLCPGDTLDIYFTWNYAPGMTQFNIHSNSIGQAQQVVNSTFYGLQKALVGVDTVYKIRIKTNANHALGPGTISTDWVNTMPLYFMCKPSDPTGVDSWGADKKWRYQNMNGEWVEPRVGDLLRREDGVKVLITP